jgi:hypothetical protein
LQGVVCRCFVKRLDLGSAMRGANDPLAMRGQNIAHRQEGNLGPSSFIPSFFFLPSGRGGRERNGCGGLRDIINFVHEEAVTMRRGVAARVQLVVYEGARGKIYSKRLGLIGREGIRGASWNGHHY